MNDPVGADRFEIAVPDAVLHDLAERLARTRLPIEPVAAPWRYGTKLAYLKEMVEFWRDQYDWRDSEAALNRLTHYKATLDGKRVHFVLERGSGDRPLPLLISHGWPGSVVEFMDVIEPLAHPERFGGDLQDAFTVVAPSLPGYGFSDPPDSPITTREMATIFHRVMTETLGCSRYVAQGGDWGAMITSWLAHDHPGALAAIHLNMTGFRPDVPNADLQPEERAWLEVQRDRLARESGYQLIQATKPQTLSYGLTDSPAGLAAWILEKFHGWTIPGRDEPPPFDRDRLLTNIMLYWLAGPNAASWLYCSRFDPTVRHLPPGHWVEVPTGLLLMPSDLAVPPPPRYVERSYNVVHRRDAEAGGHFPAFEKPELFVAEVRGFFRQFRA